MGFLSVVERVFSMAIDMRDRLLVRAMPKVARLIYCLRTVIVSVSRLKLTISNL